MIIDRKSEHQLKEVYLHDAEVREISCNYDKHVVKIPIQLHELKKSISAVVTLFGVRHVNIDIFEPWGEGIYIQEVSLEDVKETQDEFKFIILLNSGDKITIVSNKIVIEELK